MAGASGYFPSTLPLPVAVAMDGSHNAWFAAGGSAVRVSPGGIATQFSCCSAPEAIAIDPGGNVWLTDYPSSSLEQLSPAGTVLQRLTAEGGLFYPEGLAIDAKSVVWVANYHGNSISAFPGLAGGAFMSPAAGFGVDAHLNEPFSAAVDASGNLWVSNFAGNSVVQFVGIAAPVRTPLLGPPVQP